MKKLYVWCTIISAFLGLSSCSDDVIENTVTPWQEGEGIIFGARTGYENGTGAKSRTQYSGDKSFVVNGKHFERVDWVSGDQIGIFCQQAHNPEPVQLEHDKTVMSEHYGEYEAVTTSITPQSQNSYANFTRVGTAGLHWGGQVPHTFYAVYPALNQNWGLSMNNNTIQGRIPVDQTPYDIKEVNGNIEAQPYMRVAYMVAKQTVTPNENGDAPVNLTFQSIVTALEVELVGSAAANTLNDQILGVQIYSDTQNLTGAFSCNIDQDINKDGYPDCIPAVSTGDSRTINVNLNDPNDNKKSLKLAPGQKLKFTVFMLPIEDLSGLHITIRGINGSTSRPLNEKGLETGNPIQFKAHLKHYISNLRLPDAYKANNWISRLNDKVYLSQLSIPGTGGSYTKDADITERMQSRTVDQQWNLGIRCFEISTARNADGGITHSVAGKLPTGEGVDNFGLCLLHTSKLKTIATTVDVVFNKVYDLLRTNPKEFAMLMLNYQPVEGRNPKKYIENLEAYLNSYSNTHPSFNTKLGNTSLFVRYEPGLTIEDVRGRVMIIARPTSEGEDPIGTVTSGRTDYLMIDGCGSLQDKWHKRGYDVQTISPMGTSDKSDLTQQNSMEYHLYDVTIAKKGGHNPTFTLPAKKDANYNYNSSLGPNTVWFQEWPRVVKDKMQIIDLMTYLVSGLQEKKLWLYWPESYSHKIKDAKHTLDIADDQKVYINSLCGYYADEKSRPDFEYHWDNFLIGGWGTTYGDFETFAKDINTEIYSHMLKRQSEHTTKPMGLVMMNFVGSNDVKGNPIEASYLMPGVVIANNFSFELQTNQPNQAQ